MNYSTKKKKRKKKFERDLIITTQSGNHISTDSSPVLLLYTEQIQSKGDGVCRCTDFAFSFSSF